MGAYPPELGHYRLAVHEVSDDHGATRGMAGAVALGSPTPGSIDYPGDHDWFAVTLKAGKAYRIDVEGSSTGAGTLNIPRLVGVHDADGAYVKGSGNSHSAPGQNDRVYFTASGDGTYYMAVRGLAQTEGTYRVSVTEVADDDDFSSDTLTTGVVLDDGDPVEGRVDFAADRDWFAVKLDAEQRYRIDLEGSATGKGTLRDPDLYGVYRENGTFIPGTTDLYDGVGNNARVFFTPDSSGTYYVSAGGFGASGATYQLSVTEDTESL